MFARRSRDDGRGASIQPRVDSASLRVRRVDAAPAVSLVCRARLTDERLAAAVVQPARLALVLRAERQGGQLQHQLRHQAESAAADAEREGRGLQHGLCGAV